MTRAVGHRIFGPRRNIDRRERLFERPDGVSLEDGVVEGLAILMRRRTR